MKLTTSFIIFLVATSWILMAVCPPWCKIDLGPPLSANFLAYAPIYSPPFLREARFLDDPKLFVDVDLVRLAVQFLIALIIIPLIVKLSRLDFNDFVAGAPDKGQAIHALFKGLSIVFVIASFVLVAPAVKRLGESQSPDHQVEKISVLYLTRPLSKGEKIMPNMMQLKMVRTWQAPADYVSSVDKTTGLSATKNLEANKILIQSDLGN